MTGSDVAGVSIATTTPGAWSQQALEAYRPLFTELAASLARRPTGADEESDDPMMAMMAGLSQMMAPAMLGMAVGSMVGHLARGAFGQHDLPIPRSGSGELVLVPDTVDGFAAEWERPRDDLRMWVLTQELAASALFSVPHIREAVLSSVRRHVGGFRPDPNALMEKLATVEDSADEDGDPMAALQRAFGLFGHVRRNGTWAPTTLTTLRTVTRCAWLLLGFVGGGVVIILPLGDPDDRPAGVFMSVLAASGAGAIAIAATLLARRVQSDFSRTDARPA